MNSVSFISNINIVNEAYIAIKTVDLFNKLDIYLGCDSKTFEKAANWKLDNCRLSLHNIIDDSYVNVKHGEKNFIKLMRCKMKIMQIAIDNSISTLMSDSDMVFFNPITDIDVSNYDVALSRHMIKEQDERLYGKWNAGYVASSAKDFPKWWTEASKSSRFYDQACLELAHTKYKCSDIPMAHNFGWWRINQTGSNAEKMKRLARFNVTDTINYGSNPLVSMHTHILSPAPMYRVTNNLAKDLLRISKDDRHKQILEIINGFS